MNAYSKVWSLRSKLWYAHSKLINEESTIPLKFMHNILSPYPQYRFGFCMLYCHRNKATAPPLKIRGGACYISSPYGEVRSGVLYWARTGRTDNPL